MGETRQLAEFAAGWRLAQAPPAVQAQGKRCVLETLGCALGGARTPVARAAARAARRLGEAGRATVVGMGFQAAPDRAAFLNGVSANALDFDGGIVRQGHYGPTVVGAALAVAEATGASGAELLEAVIVGYEVVTRVTLALRASSRQRALVSGYGPHQGFGAAAAAGRLLKLDPEAMVHAFGLCGAFAPVPSTKAGNWNDRPLSWTKDMVAWPALSGINAAFLAQAGFLGPRTLFEGDKGFFRMAGSDRYAPELLVGGLGERFHLLGVYFKPYPCCRWNHAALDALGIVLARRGWTGAEVAEVRVGVAREVAEDLDDHAPHNLVDAQFSLPYTVAMVLLGEAPGPAWHRPELPASAPVQAAMAKVRVEVDPGLDALFNEHAIVGAEVQVLGADGSRDQARVETPYGDEGNPMRDRDHTVKFRRLAEDILPDRDADRACACIQDLERLDRASRLGDLLIGNPDPEV